MRTLGRSAFVALAAFSLAGCQTLQHGTVLSREDDGLVRVQLGASDQLRSGSRVVFYNLRCEDRLWDLGYETQCAHLPVGNGTVTQVLGEHLALIKPDPGTPVYWTQPVLPADSAAAKANAVPGGDWW